MSKFFASKTNQPTSMTFSFNQLHGTYFTAMLNPGGLEKLWGGSNINDTYFKVL
jgi:hypothetical protein